ncbi:hypothetical protein ACTMU2_14090 [Cupriavidus basilensis]
MADDTRRFRSILCLLQRAKLATKALTSAFTEEEAARSPDTESSTTAAKACVVAAIDSTAVCTRPRRNAAMASAGLGTTLFGSPANWLSFMCSAIVVVTIMVFDG